MEKKLVPTCKYKTRIIFFDDDVEFLDYLKDSITSINYNCVFVNNLQDFINLIDESVNIKSKLPNIRSSVDNEVSDLNHSEAVCFDLSKLTSIKNAIEKDKEVSVVVVDRNLGNLDGIKVCANLGDNVVESILLTGDYDYGDAINALNKKEIGLFIDKMPLVNRFDNAFEYDIRKKLLQNIDVAVNRYFINKDSYNNKLLSNSEFKQLFTTICNSYNITSHYLIKKDTLLLVNAEGKEFILKCWIPKDFDEYYNMHYDELDLTGNKRLIDVKEKRKLPVGNDLKDPMRFRDLYYFLAESNADES